jgi:hypothetical protein
MQSPGITLLVGWVALKDRLSTRAMQVQWGLIGDSVSVFCRRVIESRSHLFFECSFTKRIWKHIMGLCLVTDIPTVWKICFAGATGTSMEEVLEAPYANWHGGLRFIMCGFKGIVLWFACIDVLKAYSFVVNLRFPSKDSS